MEPESLDFSGSDLIFENLDEVGSKSLPFQRKLQLQPNAGFLFL